MCGTEGMIGNLADDVGNGSRGGGMYDGIRKSIKDADRRESRVVSCYVASYKSRNDECPGKASDS